MKRINIEREKCQACLTCISVCADIHSENQNSTKFSCNSRGYIIHQKDGNCTPIYCRCCNDPECVATCMSGALQKDFKTGRIFYDKERCGKCFMCVICCPYGLPRVSETSEQEIIRCDACVGIGGGFSCAAACPTGALSIKEVNEFCDT